MAEDVDGVENQRTRCKRAWSIRGGDEYDKRNGILVESPGTRQLEIITSPVAVFLREHAADDAADQIESTSAITAAGHTREPQDSGPSSTPRQRPSPASRARAQSSDCYLDSSNASHNNVASRADFSRAIEERDCQILYSSLREPVIATYELKAAICRYKPEDEDQTQIDRIHKL